MAETTWRVLLFALVACASPIAIVATLAVLTSRRGRTNAMAFGAGFLLRATGSCGSCDGGAMNYRPAPWRR